MNDDGEPRPRARTRVAARAVAPTATPPPPPPPYAPPVEPEHAEPEHVEPEHAGHAEPGEGHEGGHHGGHGGHEPPDRFKIAVAIVIALVSVMAALTAWRSEVAGSEASQATREGTVIALTAQGATTTALAQAHNEELQLRHYLDLEADVTELKAERAAATAGVAKADLDTRIAVEGRVVESNRYLFPSEYVEPPVAPATEGTVYDVDRRVADLIQEKRIDTDSAKPFAAADALQVHRRDLVRLDILLIIALFLATLAQVVRRRKLAAVWLVLGALIFAGATAIFASLEL